jgi:hypothetical protein
MDDRSDQVGWTEAQWNRVREEVLRAWQRVRVAGSFLSVYGPLPTSTQIVPSEVINPDGTVDDRGTADLLEIALPVTLTRQQSGRRICPVPCCNSGGGPPRWGSSKTGTSSTGPIPVPGSQPEPGREAGDALRPHASVPVSPSWTRRTPRHQRRSCAAPQSQSRALPGRYKACFCGIPERWV